MNFRRSQNKNTTTKNLFNKKESELIKILLELEKELRDRTDISSGLFGIIFAGGTSLLLNNIEQRRDLLRMFTFLIPIITIHKLIIVHSIISRIKNVESKLKITQTNQIWSWIKSMCFPLGLFIVFFTFLLEITKD